MSRRSVAPVRPLELPHPDYHGLDEQELRAQLRHEIAAFALHQLVVLSHLVAGLRRGWIGLALWTGQELPFPEA